MELLVCVFIVFFKGYFKMIIIPILLSIYYYYLLAACISSSIDTEASLENTDDEQPKHPIKTTIVLKIQQNIGITFLL